MIPANLKNGCICAALSLPVMSREDLRRVPRLPGEPTEEFRTLSDVLASLPRVPVDSHDDYSAGAGEIGYDLTVVCRVDADSAQPTRTGRAV